MTTKRVDESPEPPSAGVRRVLNAVEVDPGVPVRLAADRRLAVEDWLLSAHSSPSLAREEWQEHKIALFPLGTLFSAVRIPGHLVSAAARTADLQEIDAFLDEVLSGGPVVCDAYGLRYYALVPGRVPRTWQAAADEWRTQDVDCLGCGTYLGVPRLDIVDHYARGGRSYWAVPMPSAGVLCAPLSVARLIAAGADRSAGDVEEFRSVSGSTGLISAPRA
ncbi:hypothetical protein ACQSMD_23130 [Streptomyces flavovirens]|uniref:hypothetical protein n=1 Tax=Streptomyces TaxID=1883 RepID=UPI00159F0822|nr:hypothetical protein [Streptomyces sp. BpilaLS-43]